MLVVGRDRFALLLAGWYDACIVSTDIKPPAIVLRQVNNRTDPGHPMVKRWLLPALVILALLVVAIAPVEGLPSVCTMKRVFGVGCPTCGMTRALHFLLRGNLHESLRYHPLLIPCSSIAAVLWLTDYRRRTRGLAGISPRVSLIFVIAGMLALIGFWVYRLSIGTAL